MDEQSDLESNIRERLSQIKSVPARNPQVASRARARFLTQAMAANGARRRKGLGGIFSFRKQRFALNLAVTVVVIAVLFVGGGTTVRAAQDDLPNEPLYGIKILSEDLSLQFESDPEAKVDRLMRLTQIRVQEMTRLVESGQTLPEQVRLRLEQHLQQTLQLCSRMEDAKLEQKLLQLRQNLQQYDRSMQTLQAHATQAEQPILEHTRTMLETQLELVDNGLEDHEVFRNTINNGLHYGQTQTPLPPTSTPYPTQSDQVTPEPGNQGNGNGLGPNNNPGEQNSATTPTPRSNNNGGNSGNNAGGNNQDKDPKDKNPNSNKPSTKTPKK